LLPKFWQPMVPTHLPSAVFQVKFEHNPAWQVWLILQGWPLTQVVPFAVGLAKQVPGLPVERSHRGIEQQLPEQPAGKPADTQQLGGERSDRHSLSFVHWSRELPTELTPNGTQNDFAR
jgi:hypothetical protein